MVLSPPPQESLQAVPPSGRWAEDWTDVRFRGMGTDCRVLFRPPDARRGAEFRRHVVRWVEDFEKKYSRFRADSLVSEINRNAGISMVPTDGELESLLALCDWFHWSTGGVFDPTALPLMELWD